MDRNIIIILAAALVALGTWFLVVFNQPRPTEEVLEAPTPSGFESPATQTTTPYDFGDAPEYDGTNPDTITLYKGFDIRPTFPTEINFKDDDWYISHADPFGRVFLGEVTSVELEPESVNLDDDDGLHNARLQPCVTQSVELDVTVPASYQEGTPLFLNALFDWSQNGAWAGTSDHCGFDVPEWGVQNLRLDDDPYFLFEPGVYTVKVALTAGAGGNVWSRFTVTTEPVAPEQATGQADQVAQASAATQFQTVSQQNVPLEIALAAFQPPDNPREWHGQGQFAFGETEDYIVQVLEGFKGLGVPEFVPLPPAAGGNPPVLTPDPNDPPAKKVKDPLPPNEIKEKSNNRKTIQKGNNGVGNGLDPQPPGNPPCNDCVGTGPGNPGNKGGPKDLSQGGDDGDQGGGKDKTACNSGQGNDDEEASEDCPQGDPGKSAEKNKGGDEGSPNPGNGGDGGSGGDTGGKGKGKGK